MGGEEESAVRREKGGSEASDRPLRSSYFSLPKSFPTKKKVDWEVPLKWIVSELVSNIQNIQQ